MFGSNDLALLQAAWNTFVNWEQVLPSVNPLVAASWKRCWMRLSPFQEVRLQPLSADHLLAAQVSSFDLISVARPIMEDIFQFVEGTETIVLLGNSAGYILDLLGDAHTIDFVRGYGIILGVTLSESQVGTNSMALALADRLPARVIGPQHYLRQFHNLAGSSAPIFDPSGRPLGALGLVTPVNAHTPHTLGLAVAGARAIEAQRHSDLLLHEQNAQLAELNAILASISEGLLVWSAKGILMHINDAALKQIDLPVQALVGRRIQDVLTLPPFVQEALQSREPLTDVEATIQVGERSLNCVLSLQFVRNQGELKWVIAAIRQEKDVLQLVRHQFGTHATSTLEDMVGESSELRRVRRVAAVAAAAQAPILIRGESGTGKTIIASAIHNESPRREGPFLVINCASIPGELMVSELLGYDEGFSARRPGGRPSKFELAQGGTIYFQDVEALSFEAQASLLNILEFGVVQRLGSARSIPVDVRIIASTSANMEKLIAQSNFRADLYYRLSSFEVRLPPLRERQKDLPLLIDRVLRRMERQLGHPLALAEEALTILGNYSWPGNVRELESVLGQAAAQAGPSEIIGPMHLPEFVRHPVSRDLVSGQAPVVHSLYELERETFLQAARQTNGNISRMVDLLGISRTTVWRRLKEFDISPRDFKDIQNRS